GRRRDPRRHRQHDRLRRDLRISVPCRARCMARARPLRHRQGLAEDRSGAVPRRGRRWRQGLSVMEKPLWEPSPERVAATNLRDFIGKIEREHGVALPDYAALHRWSVDNLEACGNAIWDFCGVVGEKGGRILVDGDRMPGAKFFPDARLNFAENLLKHRDPEPAMIFRREDGLQRHVSRDEAHAVASRISRALKALGVRPGDRIAGYLPNMPESIIAMLGATSLGAVWSSCSPDFGV